MADNSNFKTITRQIEYHGPIEWLESTLANSKIPIQGVKQFKNGVYIKSGVINWQPDGTTAAQVEDSNNNNNNDNDSGIDGQPSVELQAAIENAKVAIFKRPGE